MKSEAHISKGIRSLLRHPRLYDLLQEMLGANNHRRQFFSEHVALSAGVQVLDVGCGTGILAGLLPEDVEYIGVDMESAYIDYAKKRYGGAHRKFIEEKVGDEIRDDWRGRFDLINAHGIIHHLNDEQSDQLLTACHCYLKPSGTMITVDGVYHDEQSKVRRWFISQDRGQHIRTPEEYHMMASRYFSSIEGFVDDKYTRILPYSVFIMIMQR